MKIIVTGGAGFIGSSVVRQYLEDGVSVVTLDKLTYAANPRINTLFSEFETHRLHKLDIADYDGVQALFKDFQPDAIMHLAAETHVDRSIDGPETFIHTNVNGTFNLLRCALEYWQALSGTRKDAFRFHHVSTDEVYGSLGPEGAFTEASPYQPNSPYSASKAASDHLVRAWHETYGLPVLLTNCSNNYGPWQFPEKLIPLMIVKGLIEAELPVYGNGMNIRDWLYVEDHARALRLVLERGEIGQTYNIGGHEEHTNLDIVERICDALDTARPPETVARRRDLIRFVPDRPGHDQRYAIDAKKMREKLNWMPQESFESGLRKTVEWYLANEDWWSAIAAHNYAGQRLGQSGEKKKITSKT